MPAAERPAPSTTATGTIDAAALRRLWPEVLEVVKQSSRRTRALLDNAQVAGLDGDLVTLTAEAAPLARMIGEDSNTGLLRTALTQVLGGSWRVSIEVDGDRSSRPGPAATVPAKAAPAPARPTAEADPRDDTDLDESGPGGAKVDPEADALRLLQSTLGARPVEDA